MIVFQGEAGDQLGAQMIQTLVRAGQTAAGTGEEGRSAITARDLRSEGGLAEAGVSHDSDVTTAMLLLELRQLIKKKGTAYKPEGRGGDQLAKVVGVIPERGIALDDALVNHIVIAGDQNAVDRISADRNAPLALGDDVSCLSQSRPQILV